MGPAPDGGRARIAARPLAFVVDLLFDLGLGPLLDVQGGAGGHQELEADQLLGVEALLRGALRCEVHRLLEQVGGLVDLAAVELQLRHRREDPEVRIVLAVHLLQDGLRVLLALGAAHGPGAGQLDLVLRIQGVQPLVQQPLRPGVVRVHVQQQPGELQGGALYAPLTAGLDGGFQGLAGLRPQGGAALRVHQPAQALEAPQAHLVDHALGIQAQGLAQGLLGRGPALRAALGVDGAEQRVGVRHAGLEVHGLPGQVLGAGQLSREHVQPAQAAADAGVGRIGVRAALQDRDGLAAGAALLQQVARPVVVDLGQRGRLDGLGVDRVDLRGRCPPPEQQLGLQQVGVGVARVDAQHRVHPLGRELVVGVALRADHRAQALQHGVLVQVGQVHSAADAAAAGEQAVGLLEHRQALDTLGAVGPLDEVAPPLLHGGEVGDLPALELPGDQLVHVVAALLAVGQDLQVAQALELDARAAADPHVGELAAAHRRHRVGGGGQGLAQRALELAYALVQVAGQGLHRAPEPGHALGLPEGLALVVVAGVAQGDGVDPGDDGVAAAVAVQGAHARAVQVPDVVGIEDRVQLLTLEAAQLEDLQAGGLALAVEDRPTVRPEDQPGSVAGGQQGLDQHPQPVVAVHRSVAALHAVQAADEHHRPGHVLAGQGLDALLDAIGGGSRSGERGDTGELGDAGHQAVELRAVLDDEVRCALQASALLAQLGQGLLQQVAAADAGLAQQHQRAALPQQGLQRRQLLLATHEDGLGGCGAGLLLDPLVRRGRAGGRGDSDHRELLEEVRDLELQALELHHPHTHRQGEGVELAGDDEDPGLLLGGLEEPRELLEGAAVGAGARIQEDHHAAAAGGGRGDGLGAQGLDGGLWIAAQSDHGHARQAADLGGDPPVLEGLCAEGQDGAALSNS